jgi:hypothetical protein
MSGLATAKSPYRNSDCHHRFLGISHPTNLARTLASPTLCRFLVPCLGTSSARYFVDVILMPSSFCKAPSLRYRLDRGEDITTGVTTGQHDGQHDAIPLGCFRKEFKWSMNSGLTNNTRSQGFPSYSTTLTYQSKRAVYGYY